ncbi:hypothetical protein SJAG_04043 [Schizosaccharomyces japonicus yFS275]|uniref:PARP-type domain-containing protein n=1 Tax=Schizosaccharomyces japonicus (strain yFS275 / FY16936) TaxID=402676 RepID=B6K5R7_SCHJY|nr:hypothetical protein SJAG_04043 [Schizosaccharomyces japonicus yFS275]EEB08871.1 hypothetical protein SJAG_04043 [Schizosaccharomyces japonicus yFS275]
MEQGGAGYRIELAPNSRAGCKGSMCKKAKIPEGTLRFGTFVDSGRFQSWNWKHWGCVTPRILKNVKARMGGDIWNNLDGITALPEDLAEKVVSAIETGHVAPEDERQSRSFAKENALGTAARKQVMLRKKKRQEGNIVPLQTTLLSFKKEPVIIRKNRRHHLVEKSVLSDSDIEAEFSDDSNGNSS